MEEEQNEPIVNEFGYTQRQDTGVFEAKRESSVRRSVPEKLATLALDTGEYLPKNFGCQVCLLYNGIFSK